MMKVTAQELHVDGIRYLKRIKMPIDKWLSIPDHPVQRETEYRALRASHLHVLHPAHLFTVMSHRKGSPNGPIKQDAHTRSFIWENTLTGENQPQCDRVPAHVWVDVYEVDDAVAEKALFDAYDQPATTKGASDIVYGAIRESELKFDTAWLAHGHFRIAVHAASELLNRPNKRSSLGGHRTPELTRKIVDLWAPELLMLDKIRPDRKRFAVPSMIAALWSFAIFPREEVADFWWKYSHDQGIKNGSKRDVIQHAEDYRLECRHQGKFAANSVDEMTRWMMTFVARWRHRPVNMTSSVRSITSHEWQEVREYVAKKKHIRIGA